MASYTREQLIALVQDYARRYGIDPAVAVAQIKRESDNFRADVVYGPYVGGAGERGLSQFIPDTWARFGSGPHSNAYDPDHALTAWGKYMSYLLGLFNGDISQALIGYNGGEGHLLDPARHGGPSAAAQRYAREVLAEAGYQGQGQPTPESKTNWLLIGAVAAIALIALAASDD